MSKPSKRNVFLDKVSDPFVELISDPIIEILAIKLFEHDTEGNGRNPDQLRVGWAKLLCEDREAFRAMAKGRRPYGYGDEE